MTSDFLIFDLDGTISNPAVGIYRSINFALAHFGYPEIDEAEVSRHIGPPLDTTFMTLTKTKSHAQIEALVEKFRERYSEVGYTENVLYPGVESALMRLSHAGVRLGVCTSKRSDFAQAILEMFDLRRLFEFVYGGDVGISKADQLRELLQRGIAGPGSTMVGDRAIDIRAAKENGLASIGVLWGNGSKLELVKAGADRLFTDPRQLAMLTYAA